MQLRAVVLKLNVLPLVLDMGGCLAIKPEGEIISFAWDSEMDIQIELDERIRNIALFQGTAKYPELKAMIPARTKDAVDCPHCNGTGIEPLATELQITNIVCYCGGLGWIPQGDAGTLTLK